jgi:hypothetical protein
MGYAKLDSSILDSSIWAEPHATRVVWITMLAMANRNGYVGASVGGLAHRAHVTVDEARVALATLMGSDPDSRDGSTGERIEKVERGWRILNYEKFRNLRDEEARREYERDRKRKQRERDDGEVSRTCPGQSGTGETVPDKRDILPPSAHAESTVHSAAAAAESSGAAADGEPTPAEAELISVLLDAGFRQSEAPGEVRRLISIGMTLADLEGEVAAARRKAKKNPAGLLATMLKDWRKGARPTVQSTIEHIPNMPLGAPSCFCQACFDKRAKDKAGRKECS